MCGSCRAPTAEVERGQRVLSSPSTVCHSICKAADFFRYATTGSLLSGARAGSGGRG